MMKINTEDLSCFTEKAMILIKFPYNDAEPKEKPKIKPPTPSRLDGLRKKWTDFWEKQTEREDRYCYLSLKEVEKLLEEKKELYSLDENVEPNKIVKIEKLGLQDFMEITTYSGSKLVCGKDVDISVDGSWIKIYEVEFYEKIYEYDLTKSWFKDTTILNIKNHNRQMAYKIIAEKDTGIVVNNLIVRSQETTETANSE